MPIVLRNVVKDYVDPAGRRVRAVDGVSLDIRQGEFVTLLGPSGCGKTTTLRMIAGFEAPSAGSISIGDRDVTTVPPHQRNTPMVFQSYALFPHLSVKQNAAFGLLTRGWDKPTVERKVATLAEAMGLSALLERSPHELSGGQQQRVALLRALVTEPKVLLFDEPLSNLDAQLRVALRAELRRVQRAVGFTAVYVTHDQEEAMSLSDRVVVMERGRIAQAGSPREVYSRPSSRFVARFLGEANFVVASPTPGGGLASALGPLQAQVPPGRDEVTVVIRPESLRVTPSQLGNGAVVSSAYLGPQAIYELAVGDARLTARVANPGPLGLIEDGARVAVEVEPSALHVLDEPG